MAGQALKDRRAAQRERRSLRAGFLSANFEVHRTAILEMQEIVGESYKALIAERRRRIETGCYDFFDNWPFKSMVTDIATAYVSVQELTKVLNDDDLTKEEKTKIVKSNVDNMLEQGKAVNQMGAEFLNSVQKHLEGVYPFWEAYISMTARLRLQMMRSGSNSVVGSGEQYIVAVFKWSEQFGSGERLEKLGKKVVECRGALDRDLANALKYGPYNELDRNQNKSLDP
jgi:hypothetical protein